MNVLRDTLLFIIFMSLFTFIKEKSRSNITTSKTKTFPTQFFRPKGDLYFTNSYYFHKLGHRKIECCRKGTKEMFDKYLVRKMELAKRGHLLIESHEFVYTPHVDSLDIVADGGTYITHTYDLCMEYVSKMYMKGYHFSDDSHLACPLPIKDKVR